MRRQSNKKVCGVGINDAEYKVQIFNSETVNGKQINEVIWRCPYYDRWTGMLQRCYGKNIKEYYRGCYVCDEWLLFSNFKKWMETQDWEGKELDKDITKRGNKVYCPEYCSFVPREINILLTDSRKTRGKWPIGVSLEKRSGKFISKGCRDGKTITFGRFNTPQQAFECYARYKESWIKEVASRYKNQLERKVYLSLINWKIVLDD